MEDRSSNTIDNIREQWDRIYRETPFEALPWDENKPNAELVALIDSGQVEKGPVLDICTGTGHNALYLSRQGYTCYGIDISPAALEYARQKAEKEKASCDLSQGDASRLPYPDAGFTLVFDRGCFHSIPAESRHSFIRGVHRILKPGGKYLLLCFSSKDHPDTGTPHSFSPEDIQRLFSALFRIQTIKEITHDAKGSRRLLLSVLMEKI